MNHPSYRLPVLLMLLLCGWSAHAQQASLPEARTVRTTAYTATERDGGGYFSAIGTRLQAGGEIGSAACDWSWLPLGTVFRMEKTGRVYRIEDYGSALVGRKTIDLYMPGRGQMRGWGVRNVNIAILTMGSFERSLEILRSRQGSPHVRRMVAKLRSLRSAAPLLAANVEPMADPIAVEEPALSTEH